MYEVVLKDDLKVKWECTNINKNGWLVCWDEEIPKKHVYYPPGQIVRVEEL